MCLQTEGKRLLTMSNNKLRNLILSIASTALVAAVGLTSPLLVTSCSEAEDCFAVDSIEFERVWALREVMENDPMGGRSHFYVKVDYPKDSDTTLYAKLNDSVRLWISDQLMPASSEPVLNRRVMEEACDIFFGETDGNEWGEEMSLVIRKIYENKRYVSFEAVNYAYSGGSHGRYFIMGATFRKSDGRKIDWQDIDRTDALRHKITESMKAEKEIKSDSAFLKILLLDPEDYTLADSTFALPLPNVCPWLTKDGWVFAYQPYEILPWCHGAPACRLEDGEFQFD